MLGNGIQYGCGSGFQFNTLLSTLLGLLIKICEALAESRGSGGCVLKTGY